MSEEERMERIERALRLGPPDEPAYKPAPHRRRAGAVDPMAAQPVTPEPRDRSAGLARLRPIVVQGRTAGAGRRTAWPMTIAASIVLLIGALMVLRAYPLGPSASPPAAPDLLARLIAAGTMNIAVSNAAPQTIVAGASYIGFDVDVARAIAEHLGLRAQVAAMPASDFSKREWDLALPGGISLSLDDVAVTEPYAYWPIWLAVPEESELIGVSSLATARVCVTDDSTGAEWLAGTVRDSPITPPPGTEALVLASEDDCITAVSDDRADALLTTTLLPADLGPRGLRPVGSSAVAFEPWAVAIRGSDGDSATLIAAVNEAIRDLRESGRLTEISRSIFGGRDVTVPAE